MKRPVAVLLILWLIGLSIGIKAIGFLMVVCVLLFFLYVEKMKTIKVMHILIILGLCAISVLRIYMYDQSYQNEFDQLASNDTLRLRGNVSDATYTDGYNRYIIDEVYYFYESESGIIEKELKYKAEFLSKDTVVIGDNVEIKGKIIQIEEARNEGGFDGKQYYKKEKVVARVIGDSLVVSNEKTYVIKRALYKLREAHYNRLKQLLPDNEAQIIGTLLLGRGDVTEPMKDGFRVAGLIHILAISGLHVSIIALMLNRFMRLFVNVKVSAVITVAVLALYCLYTGLHMSTVRATLMMTMFFVQHIVERRYEPSTSLSVVAWILLLINPYYIMDIGFLLSFAAVASIFYIEPILKIGPLKEEGYIRDTLRVMIAVQIGLSPILLYYFHALPVYSIIANILVLPVVPFILGLSIIGIGISYFSMMSATFLMGPVFFMIRYMSVVIETIVELPLNQIHVGRVSGPTMLLVSLLMIQLILKKRVKYMILTVAVLVISVSLTNYEDNNDLSIHYMDIGQGDATVINYKGTYIMIDGGGDIHRRGKSNVGTYILEPFFDAYGVKEIETIFVTHSDFDHLYGIIELANTMVIHQIILPTYYIGIEDELLETLFSVLDDETKIIYMSADDYYLIGDLSLYCMNPSDERAYDDGNSASLAFHLSYKEFDALFLGDIGKDQELDILDDYEMRLRDIEVLKVAHHGSNSSSDVEFLKQISPEVSIISVGEHNAYGHPHEDVISRLEASGCITYITSTSGAVNIKTDGNKIVIETNIN